jgi:hypothetical protein
VANLELIKSYNAEGAIAAYTIVKMGANDFGVAQAVAATDKLVGVTREIAAVLNEPVDVVHEGIANVKAGGPITRGDLITSDASGNAVTAAPGAGTNNRIIGFARMSGVAGDVIEVMLSLGSFQG